MPKVEPDLVAAEVTPRGGKEREAARALQAMGFRVHAVGATISIDAPRERWKDAFAARFAPVQRKEKGRTPGVAASATRVARCVSSTGSARAAGRERCLRGATPSFFERRTPALACKAAAINASFAGRQPDDQGRACLQNWRSRPTQDFLRQL